MAGGGVDAVEGAVYGADVDLAVGEGGGGIVDDGEGDIGAGNSFEGVELFGLFVVVVFVNHLFDARADGPELVAGGSVEAAEAVVPAAEVEARAVGGGFGLVHRVYRRGPSGLAGGGVEAVDCFVGGGDGDDVLCYRGAGENAGLGLVLPDL